MISRYATPKERLIRMLAFLPVGGTLTQDMWLSRHRFLLGLTWLHAGVIGLVGVICGYRWDFRPAAIFDDQSLLHVLSEALVVSACALVASWPKLARSARASFVGFGLISSSAIFVHLSGGYIELHFHFFVMLVFLALYQDWVPFGLAIAYVALHHGVVGVLWAEHVYNHAAAINAPWTWAGIHAFFVLFASVGSIIAWRFNEAAYARTKLILDSAGEGIFGLDRQGKVSFSNQVATRMLAAADAQIIGKELRHLVDHTKADGSSFSKGVSPILAPLEDGVPRQAGDEIFRLNDGRSLPVDYTSTPIVERGEVTGVVVNVHDVTRRKQAEQQALRSSEQFRAFSESANDAIIAADSWGNIIYFNPSAERIFGHRAQEVIGKPLTLLMPERFHTACQTGIARFLASGQGRVIGKTVEVTGRKKDESEFAMELSLATWKTDGDTFFSCIARDITERKRAQEDLENTATALACSNKELEQFAYVASHDLQEPLRMITSYTSLLRRRYAGKLDNDADEFIGYAVDGAKRMQGLIQDLLTFSRVGTRGKDLAPTDCEAVLAKTLQALEITARETAATITHDKLPTVMGDETQLGQLLQNLISNGIKYRNSRPPVIHIEARRDEASWLFSVKDNGIGIDPQYAEKIFVIFQRLHTRDEYEGTGIGLAVCKKIVERHHGKIWVESELGKGSNFHFTLPA
jgi:PAS domain S-box-containing protein